MSIDVKFSSSNNTFPVRSKTSVLIKGEDGAIFYPSVNEEGILSWTNDKNLENPQPVNIKGPRGEKGETGSAGPSGPVGPQGPQGQQGIQGIQGVQGPTGAQGPKGDPGNDGADGRNGKDGYTPVKGVDYWTPSDIEDMAEDFADQGFYRGGDLDAFDSSVLCGYLSLNDGAGDIIDIYKGKGDSVRFRGWENETVVLCGVDSGVNPTDAVNKGQLDSAVGDIKAALDELHAYAQSLIGGDLA